MALVILAACCRCLVTLGFLVRVAHRGAQLEPARGGGIVLARDVDGAAEYFGEGDTTSSDSSELQDASESTAAALPSSDELPIDLAGALPQAPAPPSGSEMGISLPKADGLTEGTGLPSRGAIGGNQAKTSIFGAEGIGSKFVYVFDRSASMDGYQGRPFAPQKAN